MHCHRTPKTCLSSLSKEILSGEAFAITFRKVHSSFQSTTVVFWEKRWTCQNCLGTETLEVAADVVYSLWMHKVIFLFVTPLP